MHILCHTTPALHSQLSLVPLAESATSALPAGMQTTQEAGPSDSKPVDVQALMKSDPRFIARLIAQLDSQMHGMQDEKKRRQEAVAQDNEELQRIDKEIATHIQPRLVEYTYIALLTPSLTPSLAHRLFVMSQHEQS